jgi:membrane-associated phospholipid phosphatase
LTVVKSAKAPVVAWLACAVALVLLMLAAYKIGPAQRLDATLLSHLSVREDSSIGWLANMVAHLADPLPLLVMLGAICAFALRRGRPRDAVAALAVVAGANLTTQILKVALAHPRFQPILGANQVNSIAFPSGHATAATSIAIALAFVVPWRWRPAAAVLGAGYTFAVACSVLLLTWHYPSDVLGGILVAAGWGFAVLAGLRLTQQRSGSPSPRQSASRAAISLK